jgi:hypothetical protein
MNDLRYKIKENSWLAHIAARKLKASSVAMVLGSTVHLWGTTKENFLADECWVRHELCHIKQFKEHGFIVFLVKYLWESVRHGYYNNKYEAEARAAEQPDNN